ncbi:MAG: VCBS repeat-containing protein [Deltaproteobacteria bacterium]|nr:VCBS repeat-containing protein [Deltaproteobacteria bacterium]
MKKKAEYLLITFIFVTLFFYGYAVASPLKTALTPFKINSQQDMSFLQNGIFDMLASRLGKNAKFTIIEKSKVEKALTGQNYDLSNEKRAKEIGASLNAEYIILGSITLLGNSVSFDAKMIDVSGIKETISFSKQTEDKSRIIPMANLFANKIYQSLFGAVEAVEGTTPAPNAPVAQDASNIHPEKLFNEGAFGFHYADDSDDFFGGLGPAPSGKSRRYKRSQRFTYRINGAAIGDINNDNFTEIVMIGDHNIFVYKADGPKIIKTDTIDTNKHKYNIAVDIADINNNGTPEIFITSLNTHKSSVDSSVYEWDGKSFVNIVKGSDWYFRAINTELGKVLYGQKQKAGYDQFENPIYELTWNGSTYVQGQKILTEQTANVLGIALSNQSIGGSKNKTSLISFGSSDKVQITNNFGKEIWKSGVAYGGNLLYMEKKTSTHDPYSQSYFPMRINISDINNDGKEDVIIVKNHEPAALEMLRYKKYISTQIFAFSWDGAGFAPMGKTRKITGRISDFAIGDFDNDGKKEIMAVLVAKEGDMIGTKGASFLISFDL